MTFLVLSHLMCASLTEDRYGVVQRDMPRILEAFVSFLSAIEDYRTEVAAAHAPPSLSPEEEAALPLDQLRERDAKMQEMAKATEHMAVVSDGQSTPLIPDHACGD
jgi:nucleoporin NDC1